MHQRLTKVPINHTARTSNVINHIKRQSKSALFTHQLKVQLMYHHTKDCDALQEF